MPSSESLPWVVKPLVPESVYTDREELLDYFYQSALKAAHRRSRSTVMLGQRRMGKTEIFKRVVNRLFFSQDPKDPHAVVPVYYSFPDGPIEMSGLCHSVSRKFHPVLLCRLLYRSARLDRGGAKRRRSDFPVEAAASEISFFQNFWTGFWTWHAIVTRKDIYLPASGCPGNSPPGLRRR